MITQTITAKKRAAIRVALLASVAAAIPAQARDLPAHNPEPIVGARVTGVIDGDTVRIGTCADVRLTGIQAPKLPLGRPGFRAWPLAERAKAVLIRLGEWKTARLDYRGRKIDRWGRLLAHVYIGDMWLQREMVRLGIARVYTFANNRARAADLYEAERAARAAQAGIWSLDWYRARRPDELSDSIGTFQIVEGTPPSSAVVRGHGFVNFDEDWRTDFTISISRSKMRLFRASGVKIADCEGKRIRVLGWLVKRNSPMISVSHPEQIEVLE